MVQEFGGAPGFPKHIPLNIKLCEKYEKILHGLTLKYSNLSYSIAEETLSTNLQSVLEAVGFKTYSQPGQLPKTLVPAIVGWLKKNRLVLLHYQPKHSETNLIDIIKAVRAATPHASLNSLIPIFMGSVSSKKQQAVFKLLGAFGIRYVIFISGHVNAEERNIVEVLTGLEKFWKLAKAGFEGAQKAKEGVKGLTAEKIEKYKKKMAQGDKLMESGHYEEAIMHFTEAIEVNPDFDILLKRGDALYKDEQYMPALADYREANKLKQEKADPYAKISACCFSIAKDVAKKEGPEKAKQWISAGMKNLGTAVKITDKIEKGIKKEPGKATRTPYAAIVSAISDGDIRGLGLEEEEKQIAALTSTVLAKTADTDYLDPDIDLEERINKAMLLARHRQYDQAEKIFRQIVTEDIENIGPAFNNFAVECRKNGQHGRSFKIYVELLKHEIPDKDIVIRNLRTAGTKYILYLKNVNKEKEAEGVNRIMYSFKLPGE